MLEKLFVLFFIISAVTNRCLVESDAIGERSTVVQVSKPSKNPDLPLVKATLARCSDDEAKCTPTIQIEAWMIPKDDHETFLIIDEVYCQRDRQKLPLLHPYMIQVTTGEQTLMYPLRLNQLLDVSCDGAVQRREADDGEALTNEGAEWQIAFDLFSQLFN